MRRVFRFGQKLHGNDIPCVPAHYRSGPGSPSGRLVEALLQTATGEVWLGLRTGSLPGRQHERLIPLSDAQPDRTPAGILTLRGGLRITCHEGTVGKLEGLALDVRLGVAVELLVHVRGNVLADMPSNTAPLAPLLAVAGQDILLPPAWVVAVEEEEGAGFLGGAEEVVRLSASPEQIASATPLRADADLAASVIEMLTENPALEPYMAGLDVEVHDGDVTLRGTVPTPRHRASAEQDTWHVPGVLDVHNELRVRG